MSRIPQEELERVKNETDLMALIRSSGVDLKKQGRNWIGHCPFHDDKTPSLSVTPAKNLWNCLGACSMGGSAFDWVMKSKGVSFRHAYEILRAEQGLSSVSDGKVTKFNTIPQLESPVTCDADDQTVLKEVIDYYQQTLNNSPDALKYLEKRGLTNPKAWTTFKIGYANRTLGLRIPRKNREEGASLRKQLAKLGLYRPTGHEHFSGSVVIPLFNEEGTVTQIYGRKIRDDLRPGTLYHNYLPTPHQSIWNPKCLESKNIILCEALLDALTFWSYGFENVTASYGINGFTEHHLRLFLENGVRTVTVAYDADQAGNQAAQTLSTTLISEGITCYRVKFPHNMDANSSILELPQEERKNHLSRLINGAEWMGSATNGVPVRPSDPEILDKFNALTSSEKPKKTELPSPTNQSPPTESTEPKISNGAAIRVPTKTENGIVHITLGERSWRVLNFEKNLSYGLLKVNLRVSLDERFHVDTLDLYQARFRELFITKAAQELTLKAEIIKRDVGRIILKLEELQEEMITAATTPEEKEIILSEAETKRAIDYLQAPDLIERILTDFEACGLIGEETNKLVGYLAATSRKFEKPLAVMIQSASDAGKTAVMDAVLAFISEEDCVKYSAMTGQSLFYMGEKNLKHKVMAIVEEEGAEKASYPLKLLSSEGCLNIASTGKDPQSGRLVTHEYKVEGPVMVFSTTTAIDLDEEFLNRCIVLTVDETREQTEAIHEIQRHAYSLEALFATSDKGELQTLHQNMQRLLRPLQVVNPYSKGLTFLNTQTRTRRDHNKYLTLIASITFLHQYQRPIKQQTKDGQTKEYIESTFEDIELANKLAHEVLGRSLDELPPQTRKLLTLINQMVDQAIEEKELKREEFLFTRKMIRHYTQWGNTQLKTHLRRLEEMEYLLPRQGQRGQSFVYELLYDGEGEDNENPFCLKLMDVEKLRQKYLGEVGDA